MGGGGQERAIQPMNTNPSFPHIGVIGFGDVMWQANIWNNKQILCVDTINFKETEY